VKSGKTTSFNSRRIIGAAGIALVAALIPATASSAATTAAKAGAACAKAGATATASGKTLTCVKSASTNKLSWVAATAKSAAGTKTVLGSAGGAGGAGGPGDGQRPDFANNPAFQAFQTCLTSKGVTLGFGRRGGGTPGSYPTTRPTSNASGQPFTRPTMSAADQQAIADCQKSTGFTMPAFGGRGGGPDDQNGAPSATAPGKTSGGLTLPKASATASTAYTAAVATYIACLNTNGLTSVKTMADVKMIDPTITANQTALAACASQKPVKQ